jgi:hypothetical protein
VFVNGDADLPAAREVQAGFLALPLSVFEKQGLRFEVPKQYEYARFEFKPTAPGALRMFEMIGFGMKTFLSRSDDFTTPMLPLLTGSASVSQTDLIGKVSTSQRSAVSHEQRRQQRQSSRTPTRMRLRTSGAGATRWVGVEPVSTTPCVQPWRRT